MVSENNLDHKLILNYCTGVNRVAVFSALKLSKCLDCGPMDSPKRP
jgi:hypothetical protein